MASIYLSPSTQEYNQFVTGGSEEYYTNLIADAMVPYLRASGIDFTRNNPGGTVVDSINASNAGNYDFHLAIHTNAAPENLAGMIQGPNVYYYRDSSRGRAAAEIFANNLKLISPQLWLSWWRWPIMTTWKTQTGLHPISIRLEKTWPCPRPTCWVYRLWSLS